MLAGKIAALKSMRAEIIDRGAALAVEFSPQAILKVEMPALDLELRTCELALDRANAAVEFDQGGLYGLHDEVDEVVRTAFRLGDEDYEAALRLLLGAGA